MYVCRYIPRGRLEARGMDESSTHRYWPLVLACLHNGTYSGGPQNICSLPIRWCATPPVSPNGAQLLVFIYP